VGAFDAIRELFARAPDSKSRGYTTGTFSFNSGNGRCPTCSGNGFEHVEMQFLSDVYLRCPDCNGTRYRDEILEVKIDGRNIAQVLELTIEGAIKAFAADAEIVRRLQPLVDVGLDYLRLGQPVPTLSGGEAQRLKLAAFLGIRPAASRGALFLFDEPTTGLHARDVDRLLATFSRLIARGHSILAVEHNLGFLEAADWIVELGPGGGEDGGRLVAEATPEDLRAHPGSLTGRFLADPKAAGEGIARRRSAEPL
jgi:excinuclease ABC subunit A